jgi:hypothetical protein
MPAGSHLRSENWRRTHTFCCSAAFSEKPSRALSEGSRLLSRPAREPDEVADHRAGARCGVGEAQASAVEQVVIQPARLRPSEVVGDQGEVGLTGTERAVREEAAIGRVMARGAARRSRPGPASG